MVSDAMLDVRESFRQTASNLAKVHKKHWPFLSHLICEKVRSRRGSGVSMDSSNSKNSSAEAHNSPGSMGAAS